MTNEGSEPYSTADMGVGVNLNSTWGNGPNPVVGGLKEAGRGIMGISGGDISNKDPQRLEITIRVGGSRADNNRAGRWQRGSRWISHLE